MQALAAGDSGAIVEGHWGHKANTSSQANMCHTFCNVLYMSSCLKLALVLHTAIQVSMSDLMIVKHRKHKHQETEVVGLRVRGI